MKICILLFHLPFAVMAKNVDSQLAESGVFDEPNFTMIDGFRVESALINKIVGGDSFLEKHKTRIVIVEKPDYPMVAIEKKFTESKPYSVGVYKKDSGEPNVIVVDRDGDGVFDYLQFSVFSKTGTATKEIFDYGMDGQQDVIFDFEKEIQKIYYENKWVEAKFKENFILADGVKKISIQEAIEYFEKNH